MMILFEEFEAFQKGKTSQTKKRGRIVRVVLYRSHARGGWVEDRASGYFSDYDLSVVVNPENLVDEVDLWDPVRDRIIQTEMLKPWPHATTNLIVHSHADVNDQMSRGRPFFTDIFRDGITLYESEGFPLAAPGPLTPEARNEEAWLHYETWFRALTVTSSRVRNLLHDAYVKACYSRHYTITPEELEWLAERIAVLQRIVREVCAEHLGPRPDAFLAPYTSSG